MEEEQQQPTLKNASESSCRMPKKGGGAGEDHEPLTPLHRNPFSPSSPCNLEDEPPPCAGTPPPPEDQPPPTSKAFLLLPTTNSAGAEHLEGATDASPAGSTISFTPGSLNREIVLAKLNQEKVLSMIKAWEDNVKAKSLNRYNKKLAKITAWEKAKKARAEAYLQALEEKLEKKKAAFIEDVQNEIAAVHMKAEEERALVEAYHGEETLKAEEVAAKYRASGKFPRKFALCFGV